MQKLFSIYDNAQICMSNVSKQNQFLVLERYYVYKAYKVRTSVTMAENW